MQTSKLFSLLQTLSPSEFKQFGKFVASPYFNTNPSRVAFYKAIQTCFPRINHPKLNKQQVFSKLFPGKAYDDRFMRNLMLDMNNLLKKFLLQEELEKQKNVQQELLMDAYIRKYRLDDFKRLFNQQYKIYEDIAIKNRHQHFEFYRLLEKYYYIPGLDLSLVDRKILLDALHAMNMYFVLTNINLVIALHSRFVSLNEALPEFYFLNYFKEYVNALKEKDQYIIKNYLMAIDFYKEPSADGVEKLKTNFQETFQFLSPFDKELILRIISGQMNMLIAGGHVAYISKIYDLFKWGIGTEVLKYNKQIDMVFYLNIVNVAMQNKDYQWAKDFMESYKSYLPSAQREEIYHLAKATVEVYTKNFDRVIKFLSPFSFINSPFGARYRIILLQSYFEIMLTDSSYQKILLSHCRNFTKYISRNDNMHPSRKIRLSNTIKLVQRISKKFPISDLKIIEEFKSSVNNTNAIALKKWVLQKISELEHPFT